MRWQELIVDTLRTALDFTLSNAELYDLIQAETKNEKGAVRSALSRMYNKGIVSRIERGVYRLEQLFRLFRHTKRILETHTDSPQHSFDIDVEATSEGLVPITAFENVMINKAKFSTKPNKKANELMQELIKRIEKIINPELIDETMSILAREDIMVGFTADELGFADVEFNITGSEFKRNIEGEYDGNHDVEVLLINDVGARYVFNGNFFLRESDFELR